MPKDWKYFILSFAMTLFFCATVAMLVRIDATCGGFDGARTGTLLAFSPGENQVQVTLLSKEHTVSTAGLDRFRALWWKVFPLMPYPVKLGETLRECLFVQLEEPLPVAEAPPEPEPEEPPESEETERPPATSWDTMPEPKEEEPEPVERDARLEYSPLFSAEELERLEQERQAREEPEEEEEEPEE